jgi:hypothetical protein
VDVHRRADALVSLYRHTRYEALRIACAEVKRYRRHARCDRCAVLTDAPRLAQAVNGWEVVCQGC